MTTEANPESKQFEIDEQKLNPNAELASISKLKLKTTANDKNGKVKTMVDVDKGYGDSVGMNKEELMKFADDPFWVWLRMFLFVLFWVVWFTMLIGTVIIVTVAPKCPTTSSLHNQSKSTSNHSNTPTIKERQILRNEF